MATALEQNCPQPRIIPLVALVLITAILYFGREVLIPLAVAALLSFLLAPAVTRIERLGFGRAASTTLVVALSFGVIGGLGWVAAKQVLAVAADLPLYQENIRKKVRELRAPSKGALGKATEAIKDIGKEIATKPEDSASTADEEESLAPATNRVKAASEAPRKPVPVEVQASTPGPLEILTDRAGPMIGPLGTAAAVIIFTVMMLLQREDLRNRLIRLIGGDRHLNITTQALADAEQRVSRYLRMQLIVNASFGVPVGIALFVLGIPSAVLWGLFAIALRFIPYVGPLLAAVIPIGLAFAVSDGWELVAWTAGIILAMELITNNVVEPWLYGATTGLSPIALMAATIFWTWLWGAFGLLLAVPLTVCLAVLGRHIPPLAFLYIALGDEPVLPPEARFYQRLLAFDQEEAVDLAEAYAAEHSRAELFDSVLLPALTLAEQDRHTQALDEKRAGFVLDTMRRIVEETGAEPAVDRQGGDTSSPAAVCVPGAGTGEGCAEVCLLSARDDADHVAGLMLKQLLDGTGRRGRLHPPQGQALELLDALSSGSCRVVCISAVPPDAVMHSAYLCKRLRSRLPGIRIVVGLWSAAGELEKPRRRLQSAGADRVVTTLAEAIEAIHEFGVPAAAEEPALLRAAPQAA